ncbi:MAG: hypothetical protein PHZ19_00225 [Candidatus Thermoplasmatota archaeon]|nr:hypothetical protein [Candidatus Thermoplasmatota archaeon]
MVPTESNWLFVVGPRQTVSTGTSKHNIQGFDYEDYVSGLKVNVRATEEGKEPVIRLCGKLVRLADLKAWLKVE